ncbi:MAG: hypothetical protein ACT4P0_09200 [Panacagrimonas sp.]
MRYELVKVISRATLLNSAQIECPYVLSTGRTLANGIYAVVWPDADGSDASDKWRSAARARTYDGSARFHGPFRSWRDAERGVRTLSESGAGQVDGATTDMRVPFMTALARWLDQGPR